MFYYLWPWSWDQGHNHWPWGQGHTKHCLYLQSLNLLQPYQKGMVKVSKRALTGNMPRGHFYVDWSMFYTTIQCFRESAFLTFWRNKLTADALTVCLCVFRDLWKIDLHTNIFAGYFHDLSDLFQKRRLRMSKVICDSHRWGFVPNNVRLFRSRCYFGALCSNFFEKK